MPIEGYQRGSWNSVCRKELKERRKGKLTSMEPLVLDPPWSLLILCFDGASCKEIYHWRRRRRRGRRRIGQGKDETTRRETGLYKWSSRWWTGRRRRRRTGKGGRISYLSWRRRISHTLDVVVLFTFGDEKLSKESRGEGRGKNGREGGGGRRRRRVLPLITPRLHTLFHIVYTTLLR